MVNTTLLARPNLCSAFRWTGSRYDPTSADATQNMMSPSLTYEDGIMTFSFQRVRNTGDSQDWRFTDSSSDCYYFIFPVQGGGHSETAVQRHLTTPTISVQKICISKQHSALFTNSGSKVRKINLYRYTAAVSAWYVCNAHAYLAPDSSMVPDFGADYNTVIYSKPQSGVHVT